MNRREMLESYLKENPNDSFARYGLALEYANANEVDNAIAEFDRLLKINPDYTAAYQMSAQTLMKAGRNEQARSSLEIGIACAQRTGNQHAAREMQGLLDEISD